MASGKVIGKVQVSLGNVKIVDVEGNLREISYEDLMYEGEQLYSDDVNTLFQIKYLSLLEATVYEGVFRVFADGSVVSGLDGHENLFGANIDFMDTAAGLNARSSSSAFLEVLDTEDAPELLAMNRGVDDTGYGSGITNFAVVSENIVDQIPPIIISTSSVVFDENATGPVLQVSADDNSAVSFSINAGFDSALFSIDPVTGIVTFNDSPDYENPQDFGGDNEYNISVTITDALGNFTTQFISINVNNVNEAPIAVDDFAGFSGELLENGDFETGDFTSWRVGISPTREEGASPYNTNSENGWEIGENAFTNDGFFNIGAIDGISAFNSFDGGTVGLGDVLDPTADDLNYFLEQDFTITDSNADITLSFDFDIQGGPWNAGAEARVFLVNILDSDGNIVGNPYVYSLSEPDLLPQQNISLDLSPLFQSEGVGNYTLQFFEIIPQFYTGPAEFVIDNISLIQSGENIFENAVTTIDVLANDIDVDAGTVLTLDSLENGANAVFSIVNNKLVFTPGEDFDYLAAGESTQISVVYTMSDEGGLESSATATLKITGTNDLPVITGATILSPSNNTLDRFTNDGNSAVFYNNGSNSYDSMDNATITNDRVQKISSSEAKVVLETRIPSGNADWDGARIYLLEGETLTLTSDSGGNDYYIGIDDSNHSNGELNPVEGEFRWDALALATDAGESVSLTADADGWYYIGTGAIAGENSPYGLYNTIITINGVEVAVIVEDSIAQATGIVEFADVDLTDDHIISSNQKSNDYAKDMGTFTAVETTDTTGSGTGGVVSWIYDIDNLAAQELAAGQVVTEVYTITIDDQNGGSVTHDITVTITGTNDGVFLSATDIAGDITEGSTLGDLTDTGDITFTDVDLSDTHTVSVSNPSAGALGTLTAVVSEGVDADNGTVTWTYAVSDADIQYLAHDETKVETFDITIDDGNGGTDTQTVSVTITGTNDAPIAVLDGSTAIAVNTESISDALVFDSRGANPELLGGATSLDISLTILSTTDSSQAGLLSYSVAGSNNEFLIFTSNNGKSIGIYINGESKYVTVDDLFDGSEHNINVSWNSILGTTIVSVDGVERGSFTDHAQGHTIGENGVLMLGQEQDSVGGGFDVNQIFEGEYSNLSITTDGVELAHYEMDTIDNGVVSDSVGGFDLNLVSNAGVVQHADFLTTDEDIPLIIDAIDLLANDTDIDNDHADLTITSVQGATNGTVLLVAGVITFDPDTNYSGDASFTYTVSDGSGGTDTKIVHLSVDPVNDAPIALDDTYNTNLDAIAVNTTATDGALVFDSRGANPELLGGATSLDISLTILSTTDSSQAGLLSYSVAGSNNEFLIFTSNNGKSIGIYINGESKYVTVDDLFDGSEHNINVSWNSILGTTIVSVDGVERGSFTDHAQGHTIGENGVLMLGQEQDSVGGGFDVNQIFEGEYSNLSITTDGVEVAHYEMDNLNSGVVIDSVGRLHLSTTGDVSIASHSNPLVTNEDTPLTIDFATLLANDNDIDGDAITISSVSNPINGTVEIVNGEIVFTPTPNYNGEATFTYTVNDGTVDSLPATVTLNILAVNDAPVAVDDNIINNAGEVLVSETFENGTATGWTDNSVDTSGTELTNFLGRFGGTNGTEAVSKTFSFGAGHAGEEVTIEFDMYEIDSWDGESFKVFIDGAEYSSDSMRHGHLDGGTPTQNNVFSGWSDEIHHYSVTTTLDVNGEVQLGFGSTLNQSIADESWGVDNLTITASDAWSNEVISTNEDTSITLDLLDNDSDIDGDSLNISKVNNQDISSGQTINVEHGSVTLDADGKAVFTPEENYNGSVSFEYIINDGTTDSLPATVTLNVVDVNDVPIIMVVDNQSNVNEGTVLVSETFENGTATGWTDNSVDTSGTELTNFLGRFGGTNGTEAVSKTFSFGAGHAGEEVTIEFDMYEIDSWDGESFKVFIDGAEYSSDSMRHGHLDGGTPTQNNVFSGWSDEIHHYSVTTTLDVNGEVQLGFGSTLNQSIADESWGIDNITITATNDWAKVEVEEDAIEQVIAQASDIDGTIDSSTLSANHGIVTLEVNGDITYTPNENYDGSDIVKISVTDDDGATTTQTIVVDVTPVNDAPVANIDQFEDGATAGTVVTALYAHDGILLYQDDPSSSEHLYVTKDHKYFDHSNMGYTGYNYMGSELNDDLSDSLNDDWFIDHGISLSDLRGGIIEFENGIVGKIDTASNGYTRLNGTEESSYIYYKVYDGLDADPMTVDENGNTISIDVLVNDTDVDSAVLTINSIDNVTGKGVATHDGNQISFNPNDEFNYLAKGETEEVIVKYTITDGDLVSNESEVVIVVTGSDDLPTVTSQLVSSVVFSDNFNNGNLDAWTEISFNNIDIGHWTLINNVLGERSNSANGIMSYDMGINSIISDYSISVDVWANTGNTYNNDVGITFGYVDSTNYYSVQWVDYSTSYENNMSNTHKDFNLVKVENGVSTILDTIDHAELDNEFNLSVDVSTDGGIIVSVNGIETLSASNENPQIGTIGLNTGDNDGGIGYDNVVIQNTDQILFINDIDGGSIDLLALTEMATQDKSLDKIELTGKTEITISLDDVVEVTDSDNELLIISTDDVTDIVHLDHNNFNVSASVNDGTFTTYTSTGGIETALITIENTIDVDYY